MNGAKWWISPDKLSEINTITIATLFIILILSVIINDLIVEKFGDILFILGFKLGKIFY